MKNTKLISTDIILMKNILTPQMKRRLVSGVVLFHTSAIVFNVWLSFCAQFVAVSRVTQPLETLLCVYHRMKIIKKKANEISVLL